MPAKGNNISPQDFVNLKALVKKEMQRRTNAKSSGSMAAYCNSNYDYSEIPNSSKLIKDEHVQKITQPIDATTGSKTTPSSKATIYADVLDKAAVTIANLSKKGITSQDTGCASACSGLCSGNCYSTCTGCTGSCSGTCTGCGAACSNNCTGCTGGCNGCTGCSGTCSGSCTGSCSTTCTGSCAGSCKGTCERECTGCGYSCQTDCEDTCDSSCTGDCTNHCQGTCSVQCGDEAACHGTCAGFCSALAF